jgi:hypothetical protein
MLRQSLIILTTSALALSASAFASEIYRWTDDQGNVHYVDRPTGNPTEQRLSIVSSRTDHAAVRQNVQARLDQQATREEQRARVAEEEQAAAEAEARQAERQKQCEEYRARMERYLQARRLYREDGAGERVYLDDAQIQEARTRVQEKIQETCD